MKIGKHRIVLGKRWFQTKKPSIFRRFLFLTVVTEVDVYSMSIKPQYQLGKKATGGERVFRYVRFRGNNDTT